MPAFADETQLVVPGVWHWQLYDPEVKTELCATAVQGAGGLVFIDPIPLAYEALDELQEAAMPAAILLTNGNHARAAVEYKKRLGVRIHAHPDAIAELGIPGIDPVQEGDMLAGDLLVAGLPGAGAGEVALFSPRGSLHVGDALVNCPPYGFATLPDKYCADPRALRAALHRAAGLPFHLLTFAHGLPMITSANQRLLQLVS